MISRLTFRVGDVLGAAALPPDLPRYVLSTARLNKTAHAKRKIDSAKVQKERAKQARENPGGNPLHEARRRAKSASLAEKLARKLPDPTIGGHNLKRSFVPNGSFGGKTARGLPANTRGSFPVLVAGSPTESTGPQCSRPNFVNSKNIALLLSTWNATLDEADARLGGYRGTRVGEASHPGPRPRQASMCTEFRLRSLNCQSPNGAWSFFADCCEFAERQVIALQETRMAPAEEAAFLRYALKQGFHAHSVCGELDRGGRPRGRSFTFG